MLKAMNRTTPEMLSNLMPPSVEQWDHYELRNRNDIYLPYGRTSVLKYILPLEQSESRTSKL